MNYNRFNTDKLLQETSLFWQYPVITEKQFYEQNKYNPQYCGVPWATILDKRININNFFRYIISFLKHKNYYTCCQHIRFRELIPLMKIMGIKKLYTPHKIKNENMINDIEIYPCPLYAVNFEDSNRNNEFKNVDFLTIHRNYLYSFMGGFQPGYLTNIRKNIFELNKNNNNQIINTGDWHFNTSVYSNLQNKDGKLNINENHVNKTKLYNKLLLNSRFSLCPSGSGPNSIRFWESLACGSIPVLLSDTLELPNNIDWKNSIVIVNENDIENIENILNSISEEKESQMRLNCVNIYNKLKNNYSNKNKCNIQTIFTSYKCSINEPIIQLILNKWSMLNPDKNICYFSDNDINSFFKDTNYYKLYSKMKNGVAIADFFRLAYINKYGGFWFDIDLEPIKLNLENNPISLFDVGFGNISYMFIGGKPNQKLFYDCLQQVVKNIQNNIKHKTQHVMEITGPRIIQNLICSKLNIENKDGCLKGTTNPVTYFKNDEYEFSYKLLPFTQYKSDIYLKLQQKYNKMSYQHYNYI